MKTITLKEFAELAKNDEELKEKILKIATLRDGTEKDEMASLAAEYGYELEQEPEFDTEGLSDDELEKVAGGGSFFVGNVFCPFMMKIFFLPVDRCYE